MAETYNSSIAAGLIGNTVEAYTDTVDWPGSGAVTLGVDMTNAAEDVSIAIKNEGGTVVRTIEVGALEKGPETIEWDGTDDNGAVVGAGVYTIEVTATDEDEMPIEALPFIQAEVDRVTFTAGGITLWMGDAEIPMASVFSIQGADD